MLSEILNRETCAECRMCCGFDRYDIWEVPVLTELNKLKLDEQKSGVVYVKWGNIWRFKITPLDNGELWNCPALDFKTGCVLGSDKPFECAVWPFRVMDFNGERFICVSPLCKAVISKSLGVILAFLKDNLARSMLTYADIYPDIVKPFDYEYVPLIGEKAFDEI